MDNPDRSNDIQDHDYFGSLNGENRTPRRSMRLNFDTDHDYSRNREDDVPLRDLEISPIENVVEPEQTQNAEAASSEEAFVDLSTPSQPKKRKRTSITPKLNTTNDDDDGLTCPICLDTWEMTGEHRLVSLRCGHLFGESCIRRWLTESGRQTNVKACPQCKNKATFKDIRFLYAKRLRVIDRSEEYRWRADYDNEVLCSKGLRTELSTLKMSYSLVTAKLQTLEAENERLNQMILKGRPESSLSNVNDDCSKRLHMYKLFMAHNIDISREAGSRVMKYMKVKSSLAISQKSTQGLFPGYGLTFLDTNTFQKMHFLHTCSKLIRDIALNADQQLVATASMEPRIKLYDLRARQQAIAVFTPSDKALWCCDMDRMEREHFLYLGDQHGSTFLYDLRYPNAVLNEFTSDGDRSPVVNIAPVSVSRNFPNGGLLVCNLQSICFYEYSESGVTTTQTRLDVAGPFISMDYDAQGASILVCTRSTTRSPQSRYYLGILSKVNDITVFSVKVVFAGAYNMPVMTRCSQISVEENTLVAGYLQDSHILALYDAKREAQIQTIHLPQLVYDTCPIYMGHTTYLGALTENKCFVYELLPKV